MELVGIARLASRSELLEAKREVNISKSPPAASSIAPNPTCRFSGPSIRIAGANSAANTATPATPTNSWSWNRPISKTRSTPNPPPRTCCGRNWAASTPGPHRHRHGHRSLSAGRAALRAHPRHPRSLRRRAAAAISSITTKSDLVVRDWTCSRNRPPQRAGRQPHDHHLDKSCLARLMEPRAPRPELRLAAVHGLSAPASRSASFPIPSCRGITDTRAARSTAGWRARHAGAQ